MSDPKSPHPSPARLHTAAEVATRLNLSVRTIRRMIADGRLPVLRIGRAVRIRPDTLATLIGQRREMTPRDMGC
jgi:excisionase family DNA binding protein